MARREDGIDDGSRPRIADDERSGHGIASERLTRENPNPRMLDPGDRRTPWKIFEESWSDFERERELCDWERPRAGEFVARTAEMVAGLFESLEDAGTKSLVSFCFAMSEAGIGRAEVEARFRGTRLGDLAERMSSSIELVPNSGAPGDGGPDRSAREIVLTPGEVGPIEPKAAPLWADREACLATWDRVREIFGDADGSRSAQRAALLIVHWEHMSSRNIGEATSELEGLHKVGEDGAEIPLGVDGVVKTRREALRPEAATLARPGQARTRPS